MNFNASKRNSWANIKTSCDFSLILTEIFSVHFSSFLSISVSVFDRFYFRSFHFASVRERGREMENEMEDEMEGAKIMHKRRQMTQIQASDWATYQSVERPARMAVRFEVHFDLFIIWISYVYSFGYSSAHSFSYFSSNFFAHSPAHSSTHFPARPLFTYSLARFAHSITWVICLFSIRRSFARPVLLANIELLQANAWELMIPLVYIEIHGCSRCTHVCLVLEALELDEHVRAS